MATNNKKQVVSVCWMQSNVIRVWNTIPHFTTLLLRLLFTTTLQLHQNVMLCTNQNNRRVYHASAASSRRSKHRGMLLLAAELNTGLCQWQCQRIWQKVNEQCCATREGGSCEMLTCRGSTRDWKRIRMMMATWLSSSQCQPLL